MPPLPSPPLRARRCPPRRTNQVDGHMDAVTTFYVGNQSVVGKARGATMLLQLRDRYGNSREEAEALYLSDSAGTYYPLPRYQYNLDPTATGLTDATTQNIKARTYAGLDLMPLMEVPISEMWVNSRIVINPSVQYEAEGMFRITWTTTLAGSYDVALLVLPILPDQVRRGSRTVCVGQQGLDEELCARLC